MRSVIMCSLALLPVLAHAQVNQAGNGTPASASVTLQASINKPVSFLHAAAVTPAASVAASDAPMHDDIQFRLDSDPVATAARNTGSVTTVFGSSEPEATAPRLVHVVGRTLPLARLTNEENNAYVTVHLRVNDKGLPENLLIAHSAGSSIDEQTLAAVRQYRFEPATVGHVPVQSDVTVAVVLKK